MLKNDIEKTLQAHCPEPPEGFAERMDNKAISLMQKKHHQNENKGRSRYRLAVLAAAVVLVLCFAIPASRNLIIRPDSIRARETATPLVMAFSEGHGEVTEGEGLSQEAREALEVNFPGVADKLKPVNLSCEKQGIRMKVLSALMEGNGSWVVYFLQDLEGDRINRFVASYVDLIGIGDNPGYSCYLEHNQAEHKVTCVYYEAYSEQNYPEDSSLTFEAADLGIEQELKIDLVPYLREYGKTSDGVKAPEDASVYSTLGDVNYARSVKVLEDTDPLNVNLYKDVYLTGIGWINDQLHVRIQDRQQEKITIGPMSVFPMKLAAAAYFPDQKDRECDVYHVEWSSGGNGYKDQAEYIFDIRPDEADKAELAAWGTEIVDIVRDTWEVQIPANSIRAGGSRHAEQPVENAPAQGTVPVPGETDEAENAPELAEENETDVISRMYGFIQHWNGESGWDNNDLGDMLEYCTSEWKEKAGNSIKAREALKEILGNTSYYEMPAYGWLSGESGDPVRTMTLQGHGKWVQTQLSIDLKLETDGLRYIDPESIQITDSAANKSSLVAMKPEDLDEELERQWPGISKELVPMNLSCESQGFRVEVISGLVKEWESWIVYSVQDLEEDRGYDRDIDRYWPDIEMDIGHQTEQLSGLIIGYDKDERREFIIAHQQYDEPINTENRNITFKIKDISIFGRKDTDLTPLIEQYGKTVDGIESPELIPDERIEKKRNVLDFHNPLDIPIDDGILLTGIGWIDYELHVQIHYTKTADDDYSTTYFHICNSYPMGADYYDAGFTGEMWIEDSGEAENWQREVWYEYFSLLKPEDVKYVKPVLEITTRLEKVEVEQEIRIPLNRIMAVESRHAEQPVENAPAQGTVPEETDKTEVSKAAEDLESEYSILKTRNELLEMKDKLVPLNLSCEDQGIRMEVEAAAVEGREAWILYSLETTRDDLDQYHESIQFPNARWYNSMQYQKCEQRKVNVEGNKTTYLMNMEYAEPILPENGMVPVMLGNIRFMKYKDVDLTEIITEYADVSEGIAPPEPVVEYNHWPEWKHGKRIILNNSHPLDIPLWEGVVLTGTGWINGELHIQLHYTDHTDHFLRAELRQYDTDSPYSGTDGYPYILDYYEQMWDGDGDGVVDGIEFTLDPEDDMEQRKLILHLEKTAKVVEGNWTVEFPLNDIRKEGDRFEQNGLMFRLEKDNTVTLVSDPSYQQKKEIAIPEIAIHYVREIGEDAFKDCKELEKISIPTTISYIGDNAFAGCEKLVCSVNDGSYAQQYCEENGIPYEIRQGE